MSTAPARRIPANIRQLTVGQRIKWARTTAGFSHDRLVQQIGRSNRGHLIKVEKGIHTPGRDLRDAIADACAVPRELFADDDDEESDPAMHEAFSLFVDLMDRINARKAAEVEA